jgi:hypothetical protein
VVQTRAHIVDVLLRCVGIKHQLAVLDCAEAGGPANFADDRVFQERFRREAKNAAGLDE